MICWDETTQRRTQKPFGPHGAPDFEKASGLREDHTASVQRYFEAADGQIFLPDVSTPIAKVLGKLAATC